ncbi:MAG: hypothetical protein MUP11_04080 [Anaerolineales bacterium]|nr:hypothetical protein [Anaerolineales bacterium]
MSRSKKICPILLPILILTLVTLACGTGYRTTQKITGNSGEIRVRMNDANGSDSTSVEINEDYSWQRVTTTVSFSLEAGSCRATLQGEEGTIISMDASAGSPAQVYGDLITDAFGEINLQTDCQNALNLDMVISFTLK